jgi:hypothetical protein
MRYLKILVFVGALMLTASHANAQRVAIGVGIGGPGYVGVAPVCDYGYYNYYPYACAPYGYYGPEWFNGGFFIGAGPWFRGFGFRGGFRGGVGFRGGEGFRGGFAGRPGFNGGRPGFAGRPGVGARGPVGGNFRGNAGSFRGSTGGSFRGGSSGGSFHGGGASHGGGGGHGGGHR